ncbi:hypothetical protein OOK41_06935 [Micromonospora sp. NBC_01655]|uniref:hypothetical protein n=1 Tax=Micromonospora sp. NBC_01655 TaxID=2975983 RepID=UPI002253C5ED|nr:hypothetical protein [Micromonospora sp. NBC_01655]MCX4470039.1 hypothetical protein [Micromonospora sp. NBC_01655]
MLIDIADPDTLWARWGALASALATLGHDDVYWCDADGAHHDDHGGNWARLVRVEGGRAVLFGYDHEYSDTVSVSPPLDLLAGAPAWLPWPELIRHAEADQLGYAYWYDGGWSRVPYPEPLLPDGLRDTAGAVLDDDRARRELGEVVFEWGGYQPADEAAERAEVAEAAGRLLTAAADRALDAGALDGLLGRLRPGPVDVPAGLAMATRAGLTPGGRPPAVAAAAGPPPRRVRVLSDDQHDRLVWTAMRRATEAPRPAPAPTPELTELVDWARGRAPAGDGRCSLLIQVTDTALSQHPGEAAPASLPGEDGWAAFRQAGDLVRRLRTAEADPAHGQWIFLRLEATAGGFTLERRYDSWPGWLADDGRGPWRSHLRPELDRRAPAFRPAWAVLLAPEVAYLGPPPPFDTLTIG